MGQIEEEGMQRQFSMKSLHVGRLADCDECRGAGGAPVHPEQPCPGCGWNVFEAAAVEDLVDQIHKRRWLKSVFRAIERWKEGKDGKGERKY